MRRKTRIDDDSVTATADVLETSARDKFRIKSFIPVIDALRSHLSRRATVYKRVPENFSFLIDLRASREEILQSVMNLVKKFPIDVDLCFLDELLNFYLYVKTAHGNKASFSHEDMYQIIKNDKVEAAFPNVETIFRLYLCMMVTNYSGERSFSKLKRIKNVLRSTMTQERLAHLSLLSIECDKLRLLNFDAILTDFATKKARKKSFD